MCEVQEVGGDTVEYVYVAVSLPTQTISILFSPYPLCLSKIEGQRSIAMECSWSLEVNDDLLQSHCSTVYEWIIALQALD